MSQLYFFDEEPEEVFFRAVDLESTLRQATVITIGRAFFKDQVRNQKKGTCYKGLCPLHMEKTPSFYLKPHADFFKCYGCGIQGGPLAIPFLLYSPYYSHAWDFLEKIIGFDREQEDHMVTLRVVLEKGMRDDRWKESYKEVKEKLDRWY